MERDLILKKGTSGILGKNGATYNKREGEKSTSRGLYSLGFSFGMEAVDTKIEYRVLNENELFCSRCNISIYL